MLPQPGRSAGPADIDSTHREAGDGIALGPLGRAFGNAWLVTAVAVALVVYLSIENHFIQDDGFITLRYVDNFLRGHGPVWYPGSDEFGYTNFLFMLLVTAISLTGIDPVVSANIITYTAFFVSVAATYLIARRLTAGSGVAAAIVIAVIFSNFTVSSYASGLLETSLQMAFVLLTFYCALAAFEPPGGVRYIHLAAAAGTLGLLTRLDTVLLIAPAFLYLFFRIWTVGAGRRRWVVHMAVALAGAALVMSAFLAFCVAFYGHALPNTFYAKAGMNLNFGVFYLISFLTSELFIYPSLLVIVVLHFRSTEKRLPRPSDVGAYRLALGAAALIWTSYVLYVGGGFMGYRLMVPFIVIFLLLAFTAMSRRFGMAFAAQMAAFVMLTQGGQYFWFSRIDVSKENLIQTPAMLDHYLTWPGLNWQVIGTHLNELFYTGDPEDVTVALTAAGMIGYSSRLPAFDIHGLNTREVARHAEIVSDWTGHRKQASLEQMEQAGVNLIITTRYVCGRDAADQRHEDLPWQRFWPQLSAVLVPMNSADCWCVTYYVQPHPDVEAAIDRGALARIDPS